MKKIILLGACLLTMNLIKGQGSSICFNGSATSAAPITSSSGSDITSGDFNGDGIQDLASSNLGCNTISVFIGDGQSNFLTAVNYTVGFGR